MKRTSRRRCGALAVAALAVAALAVAGPAATLISGGGAPAGATIAALHPPATGGRGGGGVPLPTVPGLPVPTLPSTGPPTVPTTVPVTTPTVTSPPGGNGPRDTTGSGGRSATTTTAPSGPTEPVVPPVTSAPSGPNCPAKAPAPSSSGLDANGPQGMDTEAACSTYTQGDPRVVVAYVEGGVNWQLASGIVDDIYVNWKEVPIPCVGTSEATATMPTLGDRPCVPAWSANPQYYAVPTADGSNVERAPDGQYVVDASDWSHDPRVHDANHNGYIDPEDLIVAFSCFDPARIGDDRSSNRAVVVGSAGDLASAVGTPSWAGPGGALSCSNGAQDISTDGSGFPHDISGWNFYNDDNDPSTPDDTYPHSDGEMGNLASYCPYCMVMPVKAGAEALDETDELAQAWLFAGQTGASVVTSVTADLGYSSFMAQVVNYLEAKGVVLVEASNDFDSTDHQGGMFWPGVVPGNSVVVDPAGTGWTRSDTTSWGTHAMFDVAGGVTTSTSTADTGGLFGLLMSWGDQSLGHGQPTPAFSGAEAVQVMRETAGPVTDTAQSWPGAPGDWSEQYGYGIMNLDRAMAAVTAGQLPPAAELTSPSWYRVADPTTTSAVTVTGSITAPAGAGYRWTLEYGLGPEPTSWYDLNGGTGQGSGDASVRATLDLADMPRSFWSAPFRVSEDKELTSADQYDVTLRLVVTQTGGGAASAARPLVGTDRRSIDVVHDPSWAKGYPLKLSSSGESQPALADLTGQGRLDIIFGTADGTVEALDPATGKEVSGPGEHWPAHTEAVTGWPASAAMPSSVHPGDQAILSDVAVGSLDGQGDLSVVATTESGWVYAFNADGQIEPGWPQALDTGVSPPAVPRPALPYTRQPVQGAVAAPVLADLEGNGQLDIVQAAWDGHLHALEPGGGGAEVPGFPVVLPKPSAQPPSGFDLVDDAKLDATPAVAYFDGPQGAPTLVERSQYTFTQGAGLQFGAFGFVYAIGADGRIRPGWPVELPSLAEYYGSAQEFVTEGTDSVQAADVTGTGLADDDVAVSTVFSAPVLLDGAGAVVGAYGGTSPGAGQLSDPSALESPTSLEHGPDVPISFGTSGGAFGQLGPLGATPAGGAALHYAQAQSGAASLVAAEEENNAGLAIDEYESVYPAVGGAQSPGFPQTRMGLDFLGEPIFAAVAAGQGNAVIDGGDSDAVTGYGLTGQAASGFPKWTTGWTVFSPVAGDLFGNGRNDLVTVTREGYLFVWKTSGAADTAGEWPRWQHDNENSGNAATPLGPPGAVRDLALSAGGRQVSFEVPGQVFYDGPAAAVRLTFTTPGGLRTETVAASGRAGRRVQVAAPAGTTGVGAQAHSASGGQRGMVTTAR